jgi:7-alpha-hydroxysteroid dehydrogenase
VIPPELLDAAAARTPMARLGDVRDIAACALYLAAPASAWVTGRIFDVDGGSDAPALEFDLAPGGGGTTAS